MPSPLLLGVAATDITPTSTCDLSGFAARTQPSLGTHDPVWAKALVFKNEGRQAAILACDLLGFEPSVDARIRKTLRETVKLDGVLLTCTHTHGGPASMRLIGCGAQDDAWMEWLEGAILETVQRAARELSAVSLQVAETDAQIGMNRRVHLNGQQLHLSTRRDRPADAPPGVYDPTLAALRFVEEGGNALATIFNHACHPVSLSADNRYVSCDWPGVTERLLERAKDPGGYGSALFLQGACGDINPEVESRGWRECERIGMEAGETVRQALRESSRSLEDSPLRYAERHIRLPYRNGSDPLEVTLSALSLGDAAIVTLPGEAFCQQGIDIRSQSPFPVTLVAAYSNGNMGYLPTRDQYPLGGYEVEHAHRYYGYPDCVAPEAGELCVQTALELLAECRGN
jgi:hypothetical protein